MSAIDRITHYVAMREAKPMRGMADEIHGIHAGEEWEARLFLSDIKEIASAIRAQSKRMARLREALDDIQMHAVDVGPNVIIPATEFKQAIARATLEADRD